METRAKLGAEVMAAIGEQLRMTYDHIIAEGVPDHFAAILRRLDASPPAIEPGC